MIALLVGRYDGDRIFVLPDKLSGFTGSLAGEGPSRALHRDRFTGPRDMNRPGWNTVKLGEHALDGFAVDVGLIHLSQSVHAVRTNMTVPTLTANTEIPIRMAQTRRSWSSVWCESCGRFGGEEAGPSKSRTVRTQARRRNTQRFKQALTAGYYFGAGTVGTDPPLRPGPWRVRNRVVPVPCRGFQLVSMPSLIRRQMRKPSVNISLRR